MRCRNIQSKWSYCKRQYGNRERFNGYTVLFRYDRAKEAKLENCQTAYMSCSEVEEWEKKNAAASVSFDSGGVVEFLPIEMFSKDAKIEKGGGIKGMLISMCDCACEDEISEIVSSNDEIRKLRDALNKYLES